MLHIHTTCRCFMSMPNVCAACLCSMSLKWKTACHDASSHCSMLHVHSYISIHTACNCCMSLLQVHVPCPCCISVLHVGAAFQGLYVHGAYSCCLLTPAYTPGDGQTSRVYSNNPLLHLYISCYVTVNKPVLLYLLLHLLLQWWPQSVCTLCTVHCTSVHSPSHVSSCMR